MTEEKLEPGFELGKEIGFVDQEKVELAEVVEVAAETAVAEVATASD